VLCDRPPLNDTSILIEYVCDRVLQKGAALRLLKSHLSGEDQTSVMLFAKYTVACKRLISKKVDCSELPRNATTAIAQAKRPLARVITSIETSLPRMLRKKRVKG
jgi:hypothetical protein